MNPVICNVCRQEITVLAGQVDRNYKVKATGHALPPQKKHDLCNAEYATRTTGLEQIGLEFP